MQIQYSKFRELVNNIGKRILKISTMGGAAQSKECAPFGVDGNPIAGMTAIYAQTSNISERVVIGYINKNQLALEGEIRIYAVNPVNDEVSGYVWCHTNGITEINGDEYSSVRYQPLNTQLQNLITQLNAFQTNVQAGITSAGGIYVPVTISLNIGTAESPTVKIK